MFNRPDLVKQTFLKIKELQPKYLFLAADGPRDENLEDIPKCSECKEWVLTQINWDCEVQTLFRDKNIGCGLAVGGAITWFFEHVEMGIILEDDILPSKSFFMFCEELLHYYLNDENVMHIGGLNFLKNSNGSDSYYYSNYSHIWGWATWRRSWQFYDHEIVKSEYLNTKRLSQNLKSSIQGNYWNKIFENVKKGKVDSWGYRWHATIFLNSGICIKPYKDLVENIGFGADATHTAGANYTLIKNEIKFPLGHPKKMLIAFKKDYRLFRTIYLPKPSLIEKLKNLVRCIFPSRFYEKLKKYSKNLNLIRNRH